MFSGTDETGHLPKPANAASMVISGSRLCTSGGTHIPDAIPALVLTPRRRAGYATAADETISKPDPFPVENSLHSMTGSSPPGSAARNL